MSALEHAADWMFRDRTTGAFVVAQFPNVAILVWLGTTVVGLVTSGTAHSVGTWVGTGALAFWAGDELVRGVNPFRRMLGAVVLVWIVVGLART
jgi:hypothetical protein